MTLGQRLRNLQCCTVFISGTLRLPSLKTGRKKTPEPLSPRKTSQKTLLNPLYTRLTGSQHVSAPLYTRKPRSAVLAALVCTVAGQTAVFSAPVFTGSEPKSSHDEPPDAPKAPKPKRVGTRRAITSRAPKAPESGVERDDWQPCTRGRASPPIEKGAPRHGGRCPRFVTGPSCPMIRCWLGRVSTQFSRPLSSAFQAKDTARCPSVAA